MPVEVSDRSYRRLTRFAAWSMVNLLVVIAVSAAAPEWKLLVALVAALPLLPAIGPFQADVALNSALDDAERRRWRVALYVVPWSMTLYWRRYVRR